MQFTTLLRHQSTAKEVHDYRDQYHHEPLLLCEQPLSLPSHPIDGPKIQSHTSTPVSPIPSPSNIRRVRFDLPRMQNIFDEMDVDMMDVVDNHDETTDDTSNDVGANELYWHRNDMIRNRQYAQRKATVIRSKYPQEVEALEIVMRECCGESKKQQQQQHGGDVLNLIQTELTTLHNWSDSYVRGLEDYITPLFSSKRRDKVYHLLRYQTFLNEQKCGASEIQQQMYLLSCKLSEPSRYFALKLAVGDALAASCDPSK
jgi:hypothetical protein